MSGPTSLAEETNRKLLEEAKKEAEQLAEKKLNGNEVLEIVRRIRFPLGSDAVFEVAEDIKTATSKAIEYDVVSDAINNKVRSFELRSGIDNSIAISRAINQIAITILSALPDKSLSASAAVSFDSRTDRFK